MDTHPIKSVRGGEFPYCAPTLETLLITVEQGFQGSGGNYGDEGGAGDYLEPGNDYEL